jgi:hypothetical protein
MRLPGWIVVLFGAWVFLNGLTALPANLRQLADPPGRRR